MKKKLKEIKDKILKETTISLFADDIGIRQATLSNFLNGKVGVQLPTLMKIIEPVGMDILEKMPDNFIEVECVFLDDKKLKKGQKYKGKDIVLCFGTAETTYQGILMKDKREFYTLKMF